MKLCSCYTDICMAAVILCYFIFSLLTTEHMRIIPSGSAIWQTSKAKSSNTSDHSTQSPTPAEVSIASSSSTAILGAEAESATGFNHSPFPSVDVFITSQLTRGGVQGSIRRWTYFPTGTIHIIQWHAWYWLRQCWSWYPYLFIPILWMQASWFCMIFSTTDGVRTLEGLTKAIT